jgi:hypothetical protein
MEYIESRRAEDQEAGPVGAPGQWPVRPGGGGAAAGKISALISAKTRYPYILILLPDIIGDNVFFNTILAISRYRVCQERVNLKYQA